jgi:hypothetical protein
MSESLFAKPASEWTDDELHHGAVQAALRRNELAAAGEPERAEFLNDLCVDLVEERERRKALAFQVEDALAPSIDITDQLEQDPPDPGREARLAAAVAEWQAGKATPATTRVTCPHGHATSTKLLCTSAGLLVVAHPPATLDERGKLRTIEFATLVDGAGTYGVGCRRCGRTFTLDLAAVRQAVDGSVTMYRAT